MHLDGPVIFLNKYGNECRRSETRHIIQFLPNPDIHPPKRLGLADFRSGSIATGSGLLGDVRFTPGSDRTADIPDQQLRARTENQPE
jgi:hypothetical protein